MRKRGQVSIFIVIGILVLIVLGLIIYLNAVKTKSAEKPSDLSEPLKQVRTYVSLCLDQTLLGSINAVGLNDSRISNYINLNLSKCINFTIFEKQGIDISAGKASANTTLAPDAIFVELDYPITIKQGERTSSMDTFSSQVSLIKRQNLPVDSNGIVQEDILISNGQSTLAIPKGTKALDKDGKPLTEISMRILGAEFPIIGFFRYDFEPDGATFSPQIILTTNYKDSDLPPKFHEQELEVKYFNKISNTWVSLPSNIDVVKDKLVTPISHFSEFGPSGPEVDRQNQVFIVSDKDWKTVFQLVPMAIWTTGNESHKQPLLVFHQENSSFDADSLIHFLQQYNTEKLTLVGETPAEFDNLLIAAKYLGVGLNESQMQRIAPETIIHYWSSYDNVVYAEDNYTLAMMASVYASLINAPLVIQGSILDNETNFEKKNVTLVGSVECPANATCENYNLSKLQKKYINMTQTDKIIVVNPNDRNFFVPEKFNTELGGSISMPYTSLSLIAPILAAGRQEVIFFQDQVPDGIYTTSSKRNASGMMYMHNFKGNRFVTNTALEIKNSITQKINSYFSRKPSYLTIISDPNNIPDSVLYSGRSSGGEARFAMDRFYGNDMALSGILPILEEGKIVLRSFTNQAEISQALALPPSYELMVGRIYGVSVADTSSYIARSLFYDEVFSNTYGSNNYTGIIWNDYIGQGEGEADEDDFGSNMVAIMLNNARGAGYSFNCLTSNRFKNTAPMYTKAGCTQSNLYTSSLKGKQFITYFGHGNEGSWGGVMGPKQITEKPIPKLDLPFAITWACLTSSFYEAGSGGLASGYNHPVDMTKVFAADFLRKGGMGYIGLVVGGQDYLERCPQCIYTSNDRALFQITKSIPQGAVALELQKEYNYLYQSLLEYRSHPGTRMGLNSALFLGDPVLTLKSNKGTTWHGPPQPIIEEKDENEPWWKFW